MRVVEGNRERVQVFQGNVIARQGSGLSETFTVRKVSFQVGVERVVPAALADHRQDRSGRAVATFAGRSSTTCVIAGVRPRRSKRSASANHPVSAEDLENFEAERELQLAQEYQDIATMFRFAVETERRFYLANEVQLKCCATVRAPWSKSVDRRLGVGHVPQ